MKNDYLLALCLLVSLALHSQNDRHPEYSGQALLYRLTNEEATTFFLQDQYKPQPRHFHTLLDSSRTNGFWNLPIGHFLQVREDQGEVSVSLLSNNSISIQPLQNHQEFAFRVLDSLGVPLPDADVLSHDFKRGNDGHWNGHPVPFDQKMQAFVLKKIKKAGVTLLVRARGEAVFFEVKTGYDGYQTPRSRFFKKTARNLTHPLRWSRNLYYRTRNRIERSLWRNNWYRGYMALNKPKFLPNDTLKVKGYFTKKNGKPLRRPLQLWLYNGKKHLKIGTITPSTPGSYVTEVRLHDSLNLQLDRNYSLSFRDRRSWDEFVVFGHDFRYEDYQLDEVTYSFFSHKNDYEPGDSVRLEADGKFSNGLRIPDGRLRLVVRSDALKQNFEPTHFFDKEIRLPDTLWTHEQALDADSPTLLSLPDSIFPKVKMKVFVEALFSNSNGELQSKSLSFWRKPRPNCLSLTLDGAWLTGQCERGDSLQRKAWLEVTGNDFQFQKKVSLPFRERVNGSVNNYAIRFSPQEMPVQLNLQTELPKVSTAGEHTSDSLVFQIQNPRQLLVFFDLFKDKTPVEHGLTEAENFRFTRPASRGDDFRLQLRYVWGGALREESEDFLFFKKKLDIALELPPVIAPGATVQVKVQAKDHRQRAARNVELVAGAINGQFPKLDNFSISGLTRKTARFPRLLPEIKVEPFKLSGARLPLTKAWASKLQLDTQFLFIERGVLLRYDTVTIGTFYKNIAQFAPYLVTEGRQQAILMIYCNRQLVWFYGAGDHQPYSFIGRPGWNQIKLRTRHFEYELDSVWLKKGCKLELAIDPMTATNGGLNVRKKKMPEQFTPLEKSLIRQSFFVLRAEGEGIHSLSQGDENIHLFQTSRLGGTQLIRVGPFRPGGQLRYVLRDGFQSELSFEPGFSYSISPGRERLYEYPWFEKDEPLPVYLPVGTAPSPTPSSVSFAPFDLLERSPTWEWRELKFDFNFDKTAPGRGSLLFDFYQKKPDLLAILLEKKDDSEAFLFRPYERHLQHLSPGKYALVLIGADSSLLEKDFEIFPNTLTFSDLNSLSFQSDSTGYWRNAVFARSHWRKEKLSIAPGTLPKASTVFSDMIYGIVTDETGEPLIGVSVFLRETSTGTVTDIDGSYTLGVPPGARTLVFSYTGFNSKEVEIGATGEVSVVMDAGSALLEETVITGYGAQQRRDITGAVVAIQGNTAGIVKLRGYSSKIIESDQINLLGSLKFDLPEHEALFEPGQPQGSPLLSDIRLRKNFRDEGFWQPHLATDANGEAFFTVTFPENTTQWRSYTLGMDKRKRAGAGFANTDAFRQVMAQLALPRFLVAGDRAEVVGKALNYTGDTLEVRTAFYQGEVILKTGVASLGNALIEKTVVVAPLGSAGTGVPAYTDSLTLRYSLVSGDYGDGEERSLPVFPKGSDESEGSFFILENDTSLTLQFDPAKGLVTLRAESDALKILSGSLNYLIQYPYGCNEQVSGRLLALLLAKQLKTAMGEPFEKEDYIKKAIAMLSKTQDEQGFWGWWRGGNENLWMSAYVLNALTQAKVAGYSVPALEKGLTWLTHRLSSLENRSLLDALELFSDIGQNMDYEIYLSKLDTSLKNPSLHERFTMLKIRQAQGLPHSLDLLEKTVKTTLHGGAYWGAPDAHNWYDNSISETLLAHHILKKAGKTERLAAIERYLLRLRNRNGNWGNTVETARILAVLLPSFLEKNGTLRREASLKINGREVVQTFPFETKWLPDAPIRIEKSGAADVYFSAYQTFWNADPAPKSDVFEVKTMLQQNGQPVVDLTTSQPATLEVELIASKTAEYVMLEVPIPAGCSYGEKAQAGYNEWREGKFVYSQEVHREYFKEKVAIFFETLPAGTHRVTITLEPRFSGRYTLNPARAEEMYFSVFFGRNGVKEVEVR